MNLRSVIVACVVVFSSGCVSPPKPDICSIDFNDKTQDPLMTCTPTSPNEDEYSQSIIASLGYVCMPPEDYAAVKSYIRYLLNQLD